MATSWLCCFFILLTVGPARAGEEVDRWTPAEMMKLTRVESAVPSPDGKTVAWTETRAVMTEDLSVFQSLLYVGDVDGESRRRMTFGEYSASNPAWSPDGRWIAFLSTGADLKTQLAVMRSDGGEARPLTEVKTGVGWFLWAPDSSQIAYLVTDEPDEEEEKRKKALDDAVTVDADHKFQHLWLVPIPDDRLEPEPRRLTEGEFQVSHAYAPGFDWSPDGQRIIFAHAEEPGFNAWPTADLSMLDVESGKMEPFQTTGAAEHAPVFSPDGRKIAFLASNDPPSWMREVRVVIADQDGANFLELPATFDQSPNSLGWLDDSEVMVAEARGTETALYKLSVTGGEPRRFDDGGLIAAGGQLNTSRNMLGLVLMDSNQPPEVFVTPIDQYRPRQVSNANFDVDHPLGKTELISWKSFDDTEIEGLLTYPVGYTEGERSPLLLVIHGGPAGVFVRSYTASPSFYPIAAFAAEGYAVLRANPRGSGGRGADFRRANKNDWGGGDFQDLMAGVDHVIEMGIADPERLGVMGWSYGGFMTSWVVTHTNRFQAASIGAPVTNLIDFNGTADILDFVPDYFDGEFWDREEVYREHSPLFHVKNAQTPSLIQHGESDARVPLGQGTAFYRALKRRGVEVKMVTYPRAPHGPAEPRQILHLMEGNLEWFKSHIPVEE